MPLTFAVSTYGGCLPKLFFGNVLCWLGRAALRIELSDGNCNGNQTLPNGLWSLWAGAGAKYSWRGICGCATKMGPIILSSSVRTNLLVEGPDDSKILMKWYSIHNEFRGKVAYFPGTYLEAPGSVSRKRHSFLKNPSSEPTIRTILRIFSEKVGE